MNRLDGRRGVSCLRSAGRLLLACVIISGCGGDSADHDPPPPRPDTARQGRVGIDSSNIVVTPPGLGEDPDVDYRIRKTPGPDAGTDESEPHDTGARDPAGS